MPNRPTRKRAGLLDARVEDIFDASSLVGRHGDLAHQLDSGRLSAQPSVGIALTPLSPSLGCDENRVEWHRKKTQFGVLLGLGLGRGFGSGMWR